MCKIAIMPFFTATTVTKPLAWNPGIFFLKTLKDWFQVSCTVYLASS